MGKGGGGSSVAAPISKDIMKFVNKEITIKGNSQSESLNVASAAAISTFNQILYLFSSD